MVLKLYEVCANVDMEARTTNPKPRANDLNFIFFSSLKFCYVRDRKLGLRVVYLPFDLAFDYNPEVPFNLERDYCKESVQLKDAFEYWRVCEALGRNVDGVAVRPNAVCGCRQP
jgi:hypothetical protein